MCEWDKTLAQKLLHYMQPTFNLFPALSYITSVVAAYAPCIPCTACRASASSLRGPMPPCLTWTLARESQRFLFGVIFEELAWVMRMAGRGCMCMRGNCDNTETLKHCPDFVTLLLSDLLPASLSPHPTLCFTLIFSLHSQRCSSPTSLLTLQITRRPSLTPRPPPCLPLTLCLPPSSQLPLCDLLQPLRRRHCLRVGASTQQVRRIDRSGEFIGSGLSRQLASGRLSPKVLWTSCL